MAISPTEPRTQHFAAPDGVRLAWHELGEGRPVVLIHGLFSNAFTNWVRYGHAARLAEAGFRVVMPDLRAHGASDKPHDPAAFPPDVIVRDTAALIAHLGLTNYDLGGYSLGARTVLRLLVGGSKPGRAIVAGMGLPGVLDPEPRAARFRHILTHLGSFAQGSPEWLAEAFFKTTQGDAQALLPLLDSFVATSRSELAAIATPVLIACGIDDDDNGSAAALAAVIPGAQCGALPGNHMGAVAKPELGRAFADFLRRDG